MLRILKRLRNETDDTSSLLNDAEAQYKRLSRHFSNKEFSLAEFEISFDVIHETMPNLSNYESLKVIDCPKFESALESIPIFVRGFFMRFDSALCLHFVIDDFIGELTEFEFFNFFNSFKDFSNSFIAIFEDQQDNSSIIHWRPKDTVQIFSLQTDGNSVKFSEFLKQFLAKSLKNGHNGIHPLMQNYPKNQIRVKTLSSLLADDKCMNLLHLASRDGKLELIKFLLNVCDMNLKAGGKMAIDFAFENQNFDVVCLLLKEGSRFPRNFEVFPPMIDGLQSFVVMSEKLHEAINLKDLPAVESILPEHPNLRFFYDTQNRSALNVALTSGAFDVYKFLMSKNCTFGPHEIFKDLLKELSKEQREELTEINSSMLQCIGDKHILMLMSNTQVGPDDKQARLSLVCDALQKLNTIPGIKILLQIVAATRNFQLIFDFNREHILFLQPVEEGYVTGLFDICGRIYIGAQHLLNPSRAHEVLGVIAHELCHYVMWIVFKNTAKPYEVNDEVKRARFDQILAHCKQNSNLEGIIALVFSQYGEEMHVAELIVRIPHALGLYIDEPDKLEEFRVNYEDLNEFYEETMLVMQQKLPKIEEEAENRIRKENSSPLNFVKYHWKKILFGLFLIGLLSFFIVFIARSCLFKSCGDSRAFCVFERFTAVCKCPQNANETLYWEGNKCNECLIDAHCHTNESCFINNCFDSRNVFTCADRSKRMFSSARCDDKKDCVDGSDESYHCIYGSLLYNGTQFRIPVDINDDDFLIFINESTDNCAHLLYEPNSKGLQLSHLPVNISKVLPNLKEILLDQGKLGKVAIENFWGLLELDQLVLHHNNISDVGDAFRDLHKLTRLFLNSNKLTHLAAHWFENLRNLRELNLQNNYIKSISDGAFDSLLSLQELNMQQNNLKNLTTNILKKIQNLRILDIRKNLIKHLPPSLFENQLKLEQLYLSGNNIRSLMDPLFKNCSSLMTFVYSSSLQVERHLEKISEKAFEGCFNLRILDLSSNKLKKVPPKLFKDLIYLEVLDISVTPSMKEIDPKMFKSLKNLQNLDISECSLKTIPDYFLGNFPHLEKFSSLKNFISHLKTVWFKDNKKIKIIDFNSNLITKIDGDFIDDLKELRMISLDYNICIEKIYGNSATRMNARNREMFKNDVTKFC